MPELTKDAFRNHLQRREFAPVYVLYGAETYLRDLAAKTLIKFAFGPEDVRDFNEAEFSMNTADVRDALAVAEQIPMMSARRVIKITDVNISATSAKDTLKEDAEDALAAYLKRPSPTSILIFVAGEFNANRKLAKILKNGAVAVDFAKLSDGELTNWARQRIRDEGVDINGADLQLLVNRVGPDAQRLTNEIAKLAAAALPGKMISGELIESLIANKREMDNFNLTNLLVSGDRKNAMRAMKKIFDDGAEPLMILGSISYNFRRLLLAKEMMTSGAAKTDVSRVNWRDGEKFLAAARRTDTKKLVHALERIAAADIAIKTSLSGGGAQGSRMQIEMLVCELAAV